MYEKTCEVIYRCTAARLKIRKEYLKLTNDIISDNKIYVYYDEYIDYAGDGEESLPKRYLLEPNFKKSSFDSAMISKIINNNRKGADKRSSPNPYLIPPRYEELLRKKLQFSSKQELFWDDSENLKYFIEIFYSTLFSEVLDGENQKLKYYIELLLYDYIMYAKGKTTYDFIKDKCIELLMETYSHLNNSNEFSYDKALKMFQDFEIKLEKRQNVDNNDLISVSLISIIKSIYTMLHNAKQEQVCSEEDIHDIVIKYIVDKGNLEYFKQEALGRIICFHQSELETLFKEYFFNLENYKNLPRKIKVFVQTKLTSYFKGFLENEDEFKQNSLGLRVKNIIENDISTAYSYMNPIKLEKHGEKREGSTLLYNKLLKESLKYIDTLKFNQHEIDKIIVLSSRIKDDIERYYLRSVNEEYLFNEWRKLYEENIKNSSLKLYNEYIEAELYDEYIEDYSTEKYD